MWNEAVMAKPPLGTANHTIIRCPSWCGSWIQRLPPRVPHTQSCGEAPAAFALVQLHCLQALAASQIMLNNPTQDVKVDPKKFVR